MKDIENSANLYASFVVSGVSGNGKLQVDFM